MLTPTHLVTGQAVYVAACLATGHPPTMAQAWTAAACALLPDLDKRNGIVGRMFPYISEPLEYRFGHRTLTHSLPFTVALALLLWPLLPRGWWLAVVAGYASHPLADMMTPAGVGWFWPGRWRCVLPGNARYRMRPMGWGELAFAFVLGVAAVPLLSLAQAGRGTDGLIKSAIGDVREARATYDAQKGGNAWTLRIEGRDNRTYADIGGEYPVIGPWGANGFLLDAGDGPHTACRADTCDWYADHAVLVRGQPEAVTSVPLRAHRISAGALAKSLERLQSAGRVYVTGTLQAHGADAEPPTIAVSGEQATLRYASPETVRSALSGPLRVVALVAQVRHAPGVPVPTVTLEGGAQAPALPEELRKWVE